MCKEYRKLTHDDERRAFIECALEFSDDFPDGAFCAYMQEALGDNWLDDLERLGFTDSAVEVSDTQKEAAGQTVLSLTASVPNENKP